MGALFSAVRPTLCSNSRFRLIENHHRSGWRISSRVISASTETRERRKDQSSIAPCNADLEQRDGMYLKEALVLYHIWVISIFSSSQRIQGSYRAHQEEKASVKGCAQELLLPASSRISDCHDCRLEQGTCQPCPPIGTNNGRYLSTRLQSLFEQGISVPVIGLHCTVDQD